MKTKMFLSLLLLTCVVPSAPAAGSEDDARAHSRTESAFVATVDAPADPAVAQNDPKLVLQHYDQLMIALTQKFSASLASIADAAKGSKRSSDQAREMSAEQYQITHMQFESVRLWRGIEEQDLARVPDVEAKPDSTQENEVVMVALPFSSLQLNPSLATYLGLTPSQVEAVRQVMVWEQHNPEPLMTELRTTRERLLAIGSEHLNAKQVNALADTDASLLARLMVANAHAVQNLQSSQRRTAKEAQRSRTNAGRTHIGGQIKERLP